MGEVSEVSDVNELSTAQRVIRWVRIATQCTAQPPPPSCAPKQAGTRTGDYRMSRADVVSAGIFSNDGGDKQMGEGPAPACGRLPVVVQRPLSNCSGARTIMNRAKKRPPQGDTTRRLVRQDERLID